MTFEEAIAKYNNPSPKKYTAYVEYSDSTYFEETGLTKRQAERRVNKYSKQLNMERCGWELER